MLIFFINNKREMKTLEAVKNMATEPCRVLHPEL
jgi:hypothetical protein